MGITFHPASPGNHIPKVERLIQTIKGTVRSLNASFPVDWPKPVLVHSVYFAIRYFSLTSSSVVPWTLVLGIQLPSCFSCSRWSYCAGYREQYEWTQSDCFCLDPVALVLLNPLTGYVVERSKQLPYTATATCADPTNNELVFRRGQVAPIPLGPAPQLTGVNSPIHFDEIYPNADVIPAEIPIIDLAPTISSRRCSDDSSTCGCNYQLSCRYHIWW